MAERIELSNMPNSVEEEYFSHVNHRGCTNGCCRWLIDATITFMSAIILASSVTDLRVVEVRWDRDDGLGHGHAEVHLRRLLEGLEHLDAGAAAARHTSAVRERRA